MEDSVGWWGFTEDIEACNPAAVGRVEGDGKRQLGFVELLGLQDFSSSIFDTLRVPTPPISIIRQGYSPPAHTVTESSSSDVLNLPTRPNLSTISSESSGPTNGEQAKTRQRLAPDEGEGEEEGQHQKKTLKQPKAKKGRQREARFAFLTKSEVDHLEDGYRWRKYGQKAAKNSPFPRSYYRCTGAKCHVKKRVERCLDDPGVVVTTYEGKHAHPSPLPINLPRGANPAAVEEIKHGVSRIFYLPPPPPPSAPHKHNASST